MGIRETLKRNSHLVARGLGVLVAGLFIAGVAWTGTHKQNASHAYTFYSGHHSECVANQALVNGRAVTTVKANQTFQSQIMLYNNGNTTWSANYGFFFGENNGGTNYWNASGGAWPGDIPPGGTARFSPTLRAPSVGGTFPFNWSIGIVFQGAISNFCTGQLTVQGPPGAFTLSTTGQTTSSISLKWTAASSNAGSVTYEVYRDNRYVTELPGTTFTDSGLGCSTSHPYLVTAVNSAGNTNSNTLNASTIGCPTNNSGEKATGSGTVSTGGSGGSTSTSGGSTSSGSSTSKTTTKSSTPKLQGSSNTPATAPPDTTPPNEPDGFVVSADESTAAVKLMWNAASDDSGLKAYEVDRSTDQQNWQNLNSEITGTTYLDTTPSFSTHYYYRLRAIDNAGNASAYATTDIITQAFAANAFTNKSTTISDDSHNLSINLPAGALAEAAQCAIISDATILPPSLKNYKPVDGPYRLVCKNLSGAEINVSQSYVISWTTTAAARGSLKSLDYFGFKDNNWQLLKVKSRDKKNRTDQVEVKGATVFAAMGKLKHSSIILKILLIILLLGALGAIVVFLMILRVRRQQQNRYDDYIHKEFGI